MACGRSRYYVTDDRVIASVGVGVLDVPPEQVRRKGRLQPGRMLLVDTAAGRIVDDTELNIASPANIPTANGWRVTCSRLTDLPGRGPRTRGPNTVVLRQHAFGYAFEDLRLILAPMARDGAEPLASMGDDTPSPSCRGGPAITL